MTNIKGPSVFVPNLNQQEAEKLKQQKDTKVSTKDAERVAQQAGFQRGTAVKKRAGVDEQTQVPIPLPDEDLPENVDYEALSNADEHFTLLEAQLSETQEHMQQGETLGAALLKSNFNPTEASNAELTAISERETNPPELEQVEQSLQHLFALPLTKEIPQGLKMLAIGLAVAGDLKAIQSEGNQLKSDPLMQGIQKVIERGGQAFSTAQNRTKGIQQERGFLRTYVPKRLK